MKTTSFLYLSLFLSAFLSSGCVPVVIGAAASGAVVAHDKRTVGSFVDDEAIELKARALIISDKEINKESHINIISYNNIVLLTGETPTEELKGRITGIVRNIEKVRTVYDEIAIEQPSSALTRAKDGSITGLVKGKMLATRDFNGTRIKVVTETRHRLFDGNRQPERC